MDWYTFNLRKYRADTDGLTLLQHAVYRLLLDEYYDKEHPLTPTQVRQFGISMVSHKASRRALKVVLERFFHQDTEGNWHQDKADAEVSRYVDNRPAREAKRSAESLRRAKYRERRTALFRLLAQHGCVAPWNAGIPALEDLAKRLGVTVENGKSHASPGASPGAVPVTQERPTSESSNTLTKGLSETRDNTRSGTPPDGVAERICLAVKIFGIQNTNPRDEKLRELLKRRASLGDFQCAAAEARAVGTGWAGVLGIVEERCRARSL